MIEAAGREVRLSNPGKVYFPRPGWTKLDVVAYYLETADAREMLREQWEYRELLVQMTARDLAILGSGVQARTHLEAMVRVRDVERVRVWSRSTDRATAFALRESERHGLDVEAVDSPQAAVKGADLVCTTTASPTPILEGSWLAPGTHLNAVGYSGPEGRELDTEAIVRSRLITDRRVSALQESGDVRIPIVEGVIDETHIVAELGEVLAGAVPGRTSADEITLFEALGLAVEDAAAVELVRHNAGRRGIGTRLPFP